MHGRGRVQPAHNAARQLNLQPLEIIRYPAIPVGFKSPEEWWQPAVASSTPRAETLGSVGVGSGLLLRPGQ